MWRLVGDAATASATRLGAHGDPLPGAAPDVSLGIRELGSLYLGGLSPAFLLDAALIEEHTPGAALALGRAFRGDREPGPPRGF